MRKSGKSSKFVPLSASDLAQDKYLLPGRRPCTCEASRHNLINNCLKCGRIVCEQEGSGPCFTCKHLVCTRGEQEIIARQSKQSFKLYNKLMSTDSNNETIDMNVKLDSKLQSAIQHRDKLIEYDRNAERRTKVIDDENDYFHVNSQWLSEKERKILNKKKEEMHDKMHSRRNNAFTFDFAGRKVVEDIPDLSIDPDDLLKSDTSIFEFQEHDFSDLPSNIQPVFIEDKRHRDYYDAVPIDEGVNKRSKLRIQDKELQEMSDEGMCLSMHQPHASLLTAGIKKHEGRVWYTSYRGRLWIHAAGKVPIKEEITDIETFYSRRQGYCAFPQTYPTGCLLGCVDVVDCLPQEEYKNQFPEGESASPYVFICENPQELKLKIPMKGQHKLFKLDSNVLQAGKKLLCRQTC
ncbi:activating signal cointegrator 1 isoform X1 [Parasteatoda tepidariorum]|uniref:activating signal cointegrator 1 isoform X1 n=1 Tax=Parasteatoda tepidariorum TaxID=114398 RepID=UPI001C71F1E4|nr:activating signal cointegrator 1 isoform X1 [Parasteatoda tepidariorum]XP_042898437.1 activating signal cointegrator 1 isoform X1 [Parasteatoda tepidariorum]XP_042898438.1 activating signal cointegrator 1 isoform X1 [Parasteatoda tepidariorum]XP_042898440.1 activating signal cointegrator 1 isoform X1 [Parasteatoda tepidariorum]XP_042898441.1 activating signal cointegrator 1 isoform X2 [Parasteatoda tepidariorum]